jgi:hypothetical protein
MVGLGRGARVMKLWFKHRSKYGLKEPKIKPLCNRFYNKNLGLKIHFFKFEVDKIIEKKRYGAA